MGGTNTLPYITSGYPLLGVSSIQEIVCRNFEIIQDLISRYNFDLYRNFDLLCRNFEFLSQNFEIISRVIKSKFRVIKSKFRVIKSKF